MTNATRTRDPLEELILLRHVLEAGRTTDTVAHVDPNRWPGLGNTPGDPITCAEAAEWLTVNPTIHVPAQFLAGKETAAAEPKFYRVTVDLSGGWSALVRTTRNAADLVEWAEDDDTGDDPEVTVTVTEVPAPADLTTARYIDLTETGGDL